MTTLTVEQLVTLGVGPVDLTLGAGEVVCLSGPSGAGKSLLLRAIADLDPHEGRVRIDDVCANEMAAHEWRKRVGYLAAESAWWSPRVADHFDADAEVVRDLGAQFGFPSGAKDWEVDRLSTGEKQRWSIARLVANRPEVLLLDEPTASLDSENRERVEAIVCAYQKEHAAPVIWVSHDDEQIERIAKRHLRIVDGKVSSAS